MRTALRITEMGTVPRFPALLSTRVDFLSVANFEFLRCTVITPSRIPAEAIPRLERFDPSGEV